MLQLYCRLLDSILRLPERHRVVGIPNFLSLVGRIESMDVKESASKSIGAG